MGNGSGGRRQAGWWWAAVAAALAGCSGPEAEPWPVDVAPAPAREALAEGIAAFDRLHMTRAGEAFAEAAERAPEFAPAHSYRALAMNSTGDVGSALAAARRAAGGLEGPAKDLVEAHAAWAAGSRRDAAEAMARAAAALPEAHRAHFELGLLQLRLRRSGDAVASLRRAAELRPDHGPSRAFLARALLADGDDDGARAEAAAAVERMPEEPLAHLVAGEVARRRADYEEAVAAFGRALELDPEHVPALVGRAYTRRLLAEFPSAREDFRRAFELAAARPDGAWKELIQDWSKAEDISFDLAVSHLLEGDVDAAIAAARETVAYTERVRPDNAVFYHHALGRILLENGRLDEALAAYQAGEESIQSTSLGEQDRQLWRGRFVHAHGRILAKRGRFEEALAVAQRIEQMIEAGGSAGEAYRPSLHYLRGYIRLEQGRFDEAVEELRQADQSDVFILWLLARAHRGAGDAEAASGIVDGLKRRRDTGFRWALVRQDVLSWDGAGAS